MKKRRSGRSHAPMTLFFWASVTMLLVHALTYLFMPFAAEGRDGTVSRSALMIVGVVFWVPLLLGYFCMFLSNNYRRAFARRRSDLTLDMGQRIGLFTFFSTVPGIIADIAFIAVFAASLVVLFIGTSQRYISFVLLAVLSFAFHAHGLFNGRIYKTIRKITTRRGKNNG